MEGKGRRGHFDGVATVVEKLFRIINPNKKHILGKRIFSNFKLLNS